MKFRNLLLGTLMLVLALTALAPLADAQDNARLRLFGGYQVTRTDGQNANAWTASGAVRVTKNIGVKVDVTGLNSPGTTRVYLGGIEARTTGTKTEVFVHGLIGGARTEASAGSTLVGFKDTAFAAAIGGGVDLAINEGIAIRAAQFDYLRAPVAGAGKNNFRFATGLVLRF